MDQLDLDAGDVERHAVIESVGGRQGIKFAFRGDAQMGADTIIDMFAMGQMIAEHAHGAGGDDGANLIDHPVDVIAGAFVGVDGNVLALGKTGGAKHVVGVVMGIDDRFHRFVGDFAKFSQHGTRLVSAFHGVDDDDAVITFQHNGIGEPVADRYIDTIGDFLHPLMEQFAVRLKRIRSQLGGTLDGLLFPACRQQGGQ